MGEPNNNSETPLPNWKDRVITYNPIVYDADTDFTQITNVLLVDSGVSDYKKFVDNSNISTFPITFSQGSKGQDIVDLLADKLPTITRIAIVANNSLISSESNSKKLVNYKPYFLISDLAEGATSYSENVQLLIDLIKAHGVKNIDFLSCYSLKYDNWKAYYALLNKETGVVVGASNDQTGNIKYGGDWTMESTGVDIEAIYFTSGISGYSGTLSVTIIKFNCSLYMNGSNVAYSKNGTGSDKVDIVWDCELSGNITVTIAEDLILNAENNYFTITNAVSNFVKIDGANHLVTVNGSFGYLGLVCSRSDDTIVKNIGLLSSGTSLLSASGWIGQGNYEYTNSFIGTITNCYSTGEITNADCGGIVGYGAGNNGTCTITNCYSTGNINGSGGIASNSVGNNGTCTIKNCYTTGSIGHNSGGILGQYAGYGGQCTVENCYSTGDIDFYSGGITSIGAGYSSDSTISNCSITNCYSLGIATDQSGGIVGSYAGSVYGDSNGTCTITNCYFAGSISDPTRAYFGPNRGNRTFLNNCSYSITGLWNDNTANSGSNSGNGLNNTLGVWKPIHSDKPWKLSIFLQNAYKLYNNGTFKYINRFPISAYQNILNVKLLNNDTYYDIGTITLTQTEVTISNVQGIINGQNTYLVLYDDIKEEYADVFASPFDTSITTSTTTTTTTTYPPATTTTTTTHPPDTTTTTTTTAPPIRVISVKISPTIFTINTSATKQFFVNILPENAPKKSVTWKSSDNKIATVTTAGLVRGVSPGRAKITVTSVDDVSKKSDSNIIVVQKVTGVKINLAKVTIKVKGNKQLRAIILPSNASNKKVTWKSSNTKVATVNSNGLVKAVGLGKATITLTSVDGSKKATSIITVTK